MQSLTRRRLVIELGAVAAALGVAGCARRTEAPVAPTSAPATAKPAPAAPVVNAPGSPSAAVAAKPNVMPKRGGSVTIGVPNDWISMDPAYNNGGTEPHRMLFDPLWFFRGDENEVFSFQPGLAEKWDFTDTAGLITLRQGVKFHDGSDWDSEVFKWNIERIVADSRAPARASLAGIDYTNPVTVVDKYTARLNLTGASPGLVQQLSDGGDFSLLWMVSKAAFEKNPAGFLQHPVGSGPMEFVEHRPSDRVVLKRFGNYWMKGADGQSLPYLENATYRLIVNESVRMTEIKAHTTDLLFGVTANEIAAVKADPALTFVEATWQGTTWRLYINMRAGPFAENYALRQATLYAIDRPTMARTMAPGISDAPTHIFQQGSQWYDASVPYYNYDVTKAKELLTQAGYPNGIDISLLVISREGDQRQAEILKQMWQQVGIRATIDSMERATLNARVLQGNADYHLTVGMAGVSPADPDQIVRPYLHSDGSFNKSRGNFPQLDAAIDKASSSYDPNVRKPLYKEVQNIDFQTATLGYLWTQRQNYAYNKRMNGYPNGPTQFYDLRSVWVSA